MSSIDTLNKVASTPLESLRNGKMNLKFEHFAAFLQPEFSKTAQIFPFLRDFRAVMAIPRRAPLFRHSVFVYERVAVGRSLPPLGASLELISCATKKAIILAVNFQSHQYFAHYLRSKVLF